jgi:hypothetical protein
MSMAPKVSRTVLTIALTEAASATSACTAIASAPVVRMDWITAWAWASLLR